MDIPQYDIEYAGLLDEKNQDLFDNDTPASGLDDSDGDDAKNDTEVMVKAQRQMSGPSGLSGQDYGAHRAWRLDTTSTHTFEKILFVANKVQVTWRYLHSHPYV